ncbi:MAG TPA: hypothetical protein VD907_04300 [Verrucomicrobiae bacterium]|nr:hypothetical protein [Verrucomicrobiae bacterium]
MERNVHTTYQRGHVWCDLGQIIPIHTEGRELVKKLPLLNDWRKLARNFLNRHAQVVGTEAIARIRLALFNELETLEVAEAVAQLSQFIEESFSACIGWTATEDRVTASWTRGLTLPPQ